MYKKKEIKKRMDYMEDTSYSNTEPHEKEGSANIEMSEKSLASLPKSAYSFLADPYAASLPAANPYAIINRFNRKVGGQYAGDKNLDGGNIQQYPNSIRSGLLKVTDFMRLPVSINYRFLPGRLTWSGAELPNSEDPDPVYTGSALIDQQRQAVSEATSTLQSTTFTQMAIYDYAVITDIPMGSARRKEIVIDGTTYYAYYDLPDVIYAASRFYQVFLQEVIGVVTNYNSYRLKQGTMIRSSWNRETPKLNGMFGLHNKKTFLNLIDSLCLAIEGEYVDYEWMKQVNMLNVMPSRRSNAIMDPVLELSVRHVRPKHFKLITVNDSFEYVGTVYDLEEHGIAKYFNGTSSVDKSIWDAITDLSVLFSAQDTMMWARSTDANTDTENDRFNKTKWNLDVVNACVQKFKVLFNDVREVFDTIARANLNTWVKQTRPAVTKDTDAALFDNTIVNDIFRTVMAGSNEIHFNDDTKRWKFYTLWNLYSGIPEYDAMSGGAFLSFSAKTIDASEDNDGTRAYLPIAFHADSPDYGTPTVYCTTRSGVQYCVSSAEITMSNNIELTRLVPLPSQSGLKIRVPEVPTHDTPITDDDPSMLDNETKSHAIHTLAQVFDVAKLASDASVTVDPDLVAVYQIEIEDITNKAIAYARANGPFRGTSGIRDDLGFAWRSARRARSARAPAC